MLHICLTLLLLVSTLITLSYGCPGPLTIVPYDQAFEDQCGEVEVTDNDYGVNLYLRRQTGSSGFSSRLAYPTGLFSAYIKLPPQNYSGGVVVTFYTTNNDEYQDNHDEIDFEFLGHAVAEKWILQTNFYGNGSVHRGREERYNLWFDPTQEAHKYSIFYDDDQILFYIDDIMIRKVQKVPGMGGDFPSKPMRLFATNWDGSSWATHGGNATANFTLEPFVAEYTNFTVAKCLIRGDITFCGGDHMWTTCGRIQPDDMRKYVEFRNKNLIYSYCNDKDRYDPPLPECLVESRSRNYKAVRNQESWSREYVEKLRADRIKFNQFVHRPRIGN